MSFLLAGRHVIGPSSKNMKISFKGPFTRQIVITGQPTTPSAISHERGVDAFLLTPANRENFYAIYQIIAGEPPLYALPGRRQNGRTVG